MDDQSIRQQSCLPLICGDDSHLPGLANQCRHCQSSREQSESKSIDADMCPPSFLLSKGWGEHLDLLIVTICVPINSILGLRWFVAAIVLSINDVIVLTLESETAAPGEKAKFLGVIRMSVL